jgi:hypothetical protein
MSDKPTIQIDDDWKRQAQEEKRKLAEEAKAKEAKAAAMAAPPPSSGAAGAVNPRQREMPVASIASLVQSIVTQALFYLGELAHEGEQPTFNLDMARLHIDTLAVLEDKTKGNLTSEETSLIDQALYDLRSRFVGVARQMIQ